VSDPLNLPDSLAGWLAYIEAQHPKSIAMGLERIEVVWRRLQVSLDFPIITVGGTNGKGSTCAMLESIYHAAGYRVACYTSPHILHYNERVRVDHLEASDEQLCEAFLAIETARKEISLTYFEFGTLAAVWLFAKSCVDIAILEVGLGGRLDAVNIFDPSCAIVTSIDLDHMDYLGDNRESIGFEKAGIYRHGVPAICGDEDPPRSLHKQAMDIGADYLQVRKHFDFKMEPGGWRYESHGNDPLVLPLPALTGDFQLFNAACAIAAIQAMQDRLPVSLRQMMDGLQNVALAGRFQRLASNPQLILDVAHNPHAAQALAKNLAQQPCKGQTFAVFSMLADKDISGVIDAMKSEISQWYIAEIPNVRAAKVAELEKLIRDRSPTARVARFGCLPEALQQACLEASENDRIIIFGSFFTVSEIMQGRS
jgi:dihydrofolate synthase/folylpolyglutamate synthase